ncbi:MAG: sulfatase-like hydrolase/transferase [Candidatus Nanopelagicales bacterium]|nr:sulfatase-like hydrolase/transferase [Candidatus Nanopelagicales bacterium]
MSQSEESTTGLNRRRLLQAMGVTGAAAALVGAGGQTASAANLGPFTPRGRLTRRPNFLVVMVDEQRMAPTYETQELALWRRRNLSAQNFLREHAMEFNNHHVMAAACAPSRASIFTGQYPSLHGVSQTSGAAKSAIETDLYWLDPTTVPTMGDWFRAGGYDTYYKGKWHISDADLYEPGSYNTLNTFDNNSVPVPAAEKIYLEANQLDEFGFDGWVGPEPHGKNPLNSGSSAPGGRGRDEQFATQGVNELRRLRHAKNPWLLVTSFVNPHDITLWGDLTLAQQNFYLAQQLVGSNVPMNLFTDGFTASAAETLSNKPSTQASYRDTYQLALQPTQAGSGHQRFYYQLQKEVDDQIGRVIRALTQDRNAYRDTVVVYLSDHGELLGAHGGMFQKWHNAYDEVLKVPLMFHNPKLFPKAVASSDLTSHADLLPTMLGLAGIDQKKALRTLEQTHTQATALPGRDLSGFLLGEDKMITPAPVFFMTDDAPFTGAKQVSWKGAMYPSVAAPSSLETVVAMMPTGVGGTMEQWKYTRYWDNPQFWTTPNQQNVETIIAGNLSAPGTKSATTTVTSLNPTAGQIAPPADQFECYNITADPTELRNLADDRASAGTVAALKVLLDQQRAAKRLVPAPDPALARPTSPDLLNIGA